MLDGQDLFYIATSVPASALCQAKHPLQRVHMLPARKMQRLYYGIAVGKSFFTWAVLASSLLMMVI